MSNQLKSILNLNSNTAHLGLSWFNFEWKYPFLSPNKKKNFANMLRRLDHITERKLPLKQDT